MHVVSVFGNVAAVNAWMHLTIKFYVYVASVMRSTKGASLYLLLANRMSSGFIQPEVINYIKQKSR